MVKYRFDRWEDGSTSTTRTLIVTGDLTITVYYVPVTHQVGYNSTPIVVPATIDGQTVQPGQVMTVEDGQQITITVPAEVEA
jgi:hypothetical protein